jgi:VIT1/CCC1 family predicted Fe2+/Mn2+ transporter
MCGWGWTIADLISNRASYKATEAQTAARIAAAPSTLHDELTALFAPYSIPPSTLAPLTTHLLTSPSLLPFLMRIEHCLPPPSPHRALASAITIASAYFLGGLVPLVPYFFVEEVERGLWVSVGVMAVALWVFGWVKTGVCGGDQWERVKGGWEMVVVGGVAAGAAMGLVRAFGAGD